MGDTKKLAYTQDKGKSSLMIYEQFGELKFKYRNREFWCRGYYVDTVQQARQLRRKMSLT